jgi:hypothetical protein
MDWYASQYIGGAKANNLGMVEGTGGWSDTRPWMNDFLAAAVGWAYDLDVLSNTTSMVVFRDWLYKAVTGRLGSSGYCFQDAAVYTLDMTGLTTWAQVYGKHFASGTCLAGGELRGSYYPQGMQMSYWGNLMPALAYAVDHQAVGASDAYARLVASSNWSQGVAGYDDNPIWGIAPRM